MRGSVKRKIIKFDFSLQENAELKKANRREKQRIEVAYEAFHFVVKFNLSLLEKTLRP